jgi:hypothetical protein
MHTFTRGFPKLMLALVLAASCSESQNTGATSNPSSTSGQNQPDPGKGGSGGASSSSSSAGASGGSSSSSTAGATGGSSTSSTAGASGGASASGGSSSSGPGGSKGITDFVAEEPTSTTGGSKGNSAAAGGASSGYTGAAGGAATATPNAGGESKDSGTATPGAAAPGGRVAEVEEADIYKIDGNNLLYFNTYRGFLIFNIADPKSPKQISRLPLYGYPIEMFVSGTTVYALIRDALYLTQINGKPQFERYNTSQLVAIDIADPSKPTIIKTVDIIGQLREGVSRKIDNTIYVVSYIPQSYYYSRWAYDRAGTLPTEQAWVYSFDVTNPKAPRKVNELQIFEGGSVSYNNSGSSYNKRFQNVAISATSNALMVVENWYVSASTYNTTTGTYGCGAYESNQMSVVSIIDVSDPAGTIRRHTRFETNGTVGDQFKMTYVFDETAKTGTFFGIFSRSVWSSSGCSGTSFTQNSLESWDITDGANPVRLDRLDFGKKNELVRGTAFDVSRKVAYGITAQRVDPLYAISIADPKKLAVLSAVDGLSGDMSVFRLISDGKSAGNFLLAIGTDTSATCSGFDTGTNRQASKVAMSVIDVRDLTKVRLVQRQCVTVDGAQWGTTSQVNSNLDQAHKMIGMYSDADANVVTVPVSYYTKSPASDWWYYQYKTAVGIMTWDLSKYDDTKDETQQKVISNFGTFTHPNGTVTRTIVFKHPVTGKRSMINLSDTHASIADLTDLAKPEQLSVIEIAPYYSEIYRFGDYLVEHVVPRYNYSYYKEDPHEFRVRKAAAGLGAEPVATFSLGQVQRVIKQGTNLLIFGNIQITTTAGGTTTQSTALVYDMSKPETPRQASQFVLPTGVAFPYWYYYCGWNPWGGYYFSYNYNNWTATDRGLLFLTSKYEYGTSGYTYMPVMTSVDLSKPDAPVTETQTLGVDYYNGYTNLVADPVDPTGFYLTYRKSVGTVTRDNYIFTQYRNYAQRYQWKDSKPLAAELINLPGPLVNTWTGPDGNRMFLTREQVYNYINNPSSPSYYYYQQDVRLALLRQTSVDGKAAAELLDGRTFTGMTMSALVRQDNLMIVNARPYNPPSGSTWEILSDRLMIFDLSQNALTLAYDQPTKAYNLRIMGLQKDRAFLNLQGDGIVVVDTSKPTAPIGVSFMRTLGYATHLESFGDDIYVASGYFGLEHRNLKDAANITNN